MKILHFNWAALDVRGGVKYTIGVAIIIAFSLVIEFSWVAVGMSALLAWLVNVPGPRHDRLNGIVIFTVVGAALIGLVWALAGTYWPWLISMVAVAFLGTFAMIRGPRGFMIGWCLICLFYVAPPFRNRRNSFGGTERTSSGEHRDFDSHCAAIRRGS